MENRDYIKSLIYQQNISQDISSCYLYFEALIRSNLLKLKSILPEQFEIFYAIKANPHKEIISFLNHFGCGADVASYGELETVIREGTDPGKISFAGPGKTDEDIKAAVRNNICSLSVESPEEIEKINDIAGQLRKKQNVAIRVNPQKNFSGYGMKMGGYPSPFGIDEDKCPYALKKISESEHLEFTGFHAHVGSQILDADAIGSVFRYLLEYALAVQNQYHFEIQYINFGGGFGIPYYEKQKPLDLKRLQDILKELTDTDEFLKNFPKTRFIIEPGRFLVADAGVYLSKILYIKESRGKKFIVIEGGMHHNLSAFGHLGQVIRRNYHIDVLRFDGQVKETTSDTFDIVGSLCTPLDKLAEHIELTDDVRIGDYICVYNSGAYGYTASPLFFLNHPLPKVNVIKWKKDQDVI
ncbi:alanine racemase [Desulfonema magnum]|uniref:Diaminopimelate decarboxylase family protein n=1 Tax=Desulfonema magnum TaxID=45655 RepID=A0A975BGM0_9BACT|nr:alanine racemase [Desulfonema magnum]QTA84834.1 Diaminopimelate decarboxylase family protein [Desulfonema magnum]